MKQVKEVTTTYCDFCSAEITERVKTYTMGYSAIGGSALYVELYLRTPMGFSNDLCKDCLRRALKGYLNQVEDKK